jgi:hypothetical protein
MKKTYIIPELNITKLAVENMIAQSGPTTSSQAALPDAHMDVKADRNDYNVWDDDWSR